MSVTLLKLLVDSESRPHYAVAQAMDIHPSLLSRAATGRCQTKRVFEIAAAYFGTIGGVKVTPELLQTTITARHAVEVASVIRNLERLNK